LKRFDVDAPAGPFGTKVVISLLPNLPFIYFTFTKRK
jgi:hypothetical protein